MRRFSDCESDRHHFARLGMRRSILLTGASVTPLSPAAMSVRSAAGGITVGWIRRSREGWNWADGIEVPLGEETERYRVTRIAAAQADVTEETTAPAWIYPVALLAADRAAGLVQATVRVVQVGARAVSAPTSISVSLI